MKLDHRHGQRVNCTLPIRAQVQRTQYALPQDIESILQGPPPAVETRLTGNVRKQCAVFPPLTQLRRFFVPLATFSHQRHRQQFTVAALRLRSGSLKHRLYLLPHIIHRHIHPQAKIVKTLYHWSVSRCGLLKFADLSLPHSRDTFFTSHFI